MKILLMLALTVPNIVAQEEAPDLSHLLQVLRGRVEHLETSVPDFICKEQITSQSFVNNKVKKETQAQSVLTTTRSTNEGRGIFSESRAQLVINGKASRRSEIPGPFVWGGGPAYGDLHYLFNSNHGIECREYRVTGPVKLDGKDAILMEVHAAADKRDMCHELPADSSDRIWLEPRTWNVLRIESFDPPVKEPAPDLTLVVDYAPVVFDGVEYWLPSHFISRLGSPTGRSHMQYEAYFRDYHKYGAESVFHIDGAQ